MLTNTHSLASAFTTVTTSLVNDILLPPISVIFPLDRNMQEKFAVLKPGPKYDETGGYTTIDQAVTDGAVILGYGCVQSCGHEYLRTKQ